jgi:hypothetical protein
MTDFVIAAIVNAADRLGKDVYHDPAEYERDIATVCDAAKQYAELMEEYADTVADYERFGWDSAEEEKRAGYPYATGREERRRQCEETYDGGHEGFFRKRKACIDAFLNGYYEHWMKLNGSEEAAL